MSVNSLKYKFTYILRTYTDKVYQCVPQLTFAGGNIRKITAVLCVALGSVLFLPLISGTAAAAGSSSGISFSELLAGWGSALLDPATYKTWAYLGGFFDFLMHETFLSAFSSDSFGTLSRTTILGTIPNVFFIVCILCSLLSIAVAVIEVKKAERMKHVVKK